MTVHLTWRSPQKVTLESPGRKIDLGYACISQECHLGDELQGAYCLDFFTAKAEALPVKK